MDDRPKKEESEGILLEASMEMDEEDEDPEQVLQQQEEAVVGTTVGDEDVVAGPNIGENEFQDMGANENESSDEEDVSYLIFLHVPRIIIKFAGWSYHTRWPNYELENPI